MHEIMKLNKGITLIALVITIIVLLILAGISIAMLTGENGILIKTADAKNQTQEGTAKEKIQLSIMSSYDKNGTFKVTTFKEEIKKEGGNIIAEDTNTIIVEIDGYNASIHIQNGKMLDFYKVGEKQSQISLKAVYIGTRAFTVEVDTAEEKINKFIYYVDEEKKEESDKNTFKIEGLEPSSTHKVKAIVENENGESKDIEEITIITEPITYLYLNGNEFEEITGGFNSYFVSSNHLSNDSNKVEFDGNGKYSSGTVTKNKDNYYMTAQHNNGNSGYGYTLAGIITKKQIDFSNYKKMYIEGILSTNNNNYSFIRFIGENGETKGQVNKVQGLMEEVDLKDYNEKYYINIGISSSSTSGTSGNMTIKNIHLEK